MGWILPSATVVVSLLDSAEARGLPVDGAVTRIREGVSRGIPPQRIVGVARGYVASLTSARASLGASATADELRAGAEAVQAGAPSSTCNSSGAARPLGSIVEPLVFLADLSIHKVAPLQARYFFFCTRHAWRVRCTSVRALRTAVCDIIRGALPAAALAYRVRGNNLQPAGGVTDSNADPEKVSVNISLYYGRRSSRISSLPHARGATTLPLTLTGQTPSTKDVLIQAGTSVALSAAPSTTSSVSSSDGTFVWIV